MVRVFESVSSSASRGVALRVELGWLSVLATNGRLAVEKLDTAYEPSVQNADHGDSSVEGTTLPRVQVDKLVDTSAPYVQSPVGLLQGRPRHTLVADVDPDDIHRW